MDTINNDTVDKVKYRSEQKKLLLHWKAIDVTYSITISLVSPSEYSTACFA
jgi:hypothetical protein